jgi:hypothetical protein
VRYEGGVNHGREPSRVRLENLEPVATMRAPAQPGYIPQPPAEPTTESRPPETVTDQGLAMGAGGNRQPPNETLAAVALARLRRRHRQHQSEILCATAAPHGHLQPRLSQGPALERQHEPALGAQFGEADPEVEDDGLGAARSSDPSPRAHMTVTIDTPNGPSFHYSDAFSCHQILAAFRGLMWAKARRHRAHRFVSSINGWSGKRLLQRRPRRRRPPCNLEEGPHSAEEGGSRPARGSDVPLPSRPHHGQPQGSV